MNKSKWAGLRLRTISGVIVTIIAIGVIWIGGWLFNGVVALSAIQMWREWRAMTKSWNIGWAVFGIFYILLPCASLLWIANLLGGSATKVLLLLVLIVSSTDIIAYLVGKSVGGPKLAPAISPNKTWSGAVGGLAGAVLAVCGFSLYTRGNIPISLWPILFAMTISAISQAGDLFESWVKRRAGVKDSGTLIPGHGGLLDRLDGYMFAAPVYVLTLIVMLSRYMVS